MFSSKSIFMPLRLFKSMGENVLQATVQKWEKRRLLLLYF
jgi:hypothetical protein